MKQSLSIYIARLALVLALLGFGNFSEAFMATSRGSKMPIIDQALSSLKSPPVPSEFRVSTDLHAKREITNDEREEGQVNSIIGIDRGVYLLALVLAINVWLFSIPPEFRRTRFCNEADSQAYPDRCMTAKQWRNGIADYYKNGKK